MNTNFTLTLRLTEHDLDLREFFSAIDRNARCYKAKELIKIGIKTEERFKNSFSELLSNPDNEELTLKNVSKEKKKIKIEKQDLSREDKKKLLEKNLDNL